MLRIVLLIGAALAVTTVGVRAATVNVDLSGASSGTFIDGGGADFAGTFSGQSIVGNTGISGSPTGPLTLSTSNNLTVQFFSPSPFPAGNSILPNPGNQGPLSVLLDFNASSLTFVRGSEIRHQVSIFRSSMMPVVC